MYLISIIPMIDHGTISSSQQFISLLLGEFSDIKLTDELF